MRPFCTLKTGAMVLIWPTGSIGIGGSMTTGSVSVKLLGAL